MRLSNKIKQEIKELVFLMAMIILFLLCFSVVTGQDISYYEIENSKIELNLKPPKNKFNQKIQINDNALVFISGMTFTTIGVIQTTRYRNSHFRYTSPKGAIPINPHNLLIGLGLFTMSISFVI